MRFWGDMKAKVEEMGDCDSAHHPLEGRDGFSSPASAAGTVISGGVEVLPSQASAPVPVEYKGWDLAGAAAFPGGYQAFPVVRGATHNTHQVLSWKALMDLQDKPVEYDIFESKWTQLAGRVVAQNTALGQQDPRCGIGTDELLGMGDFDDLKRQVALDSLVLDQCQKRGMAALVQTIEMAAPTESFVTVVQGAEEPFLQFAERLTASVERQVEDLNARLLLLKHLARSNCNAEYRKIIEALPGDPSVSQMAQACAKVGTTGCKVAAVATALQPSWTGPQGRQRKQGHAQDSIKQGKKVQRVTTPLFLCGWCGRPNHNANVCKATVHANGQPLSSSGNGKGSKGETRSDTIFSPSSGADGGLLGRLTASTCGSAGLDVCTAATVVLDSYGVHKVPLDAFGPVGEGMSAFLMGRSSATAQGIIVHLGLIDADFTGQIYAMVSTPTPPGHYPRRDQTCSTCAFQVFCSQSRELVAGRRQLWIYWAASASLDFCPDKVCTLSIPGVTLSEICLRRLLDTGADITILSLAAWPPEWPLDLVQTSVAGLAGTARNAT
ncbi:hypothetical protein DUI87_02226 [Hirundo rustica rustica]|uniref:Peptidase A2 domain-containing protein n=1 Tax=Hirundo rustica rustica TaxID=333673 RepID=A0A3M0LBS2_HIRRU|nr:hypothetical protein DUI87_02226 [Hirundo rustica rustica]